MTGSNWSRLKMFTLLSILAAAAYPLEVEDNAPLVRGTINVVLANKNGMVAVTDSRQSTRDPVSGTYQPLSAPGQKLFRLDDRTVCTIAGFGSAALPALPDFTSSAIGILQLFKARTEHSIPPLSFEDKLRVIGLLFEFHLNVISNVRNDNLPGDYRFQLLMAGYDADGTPKIGRLELGMNLHSDGIFATVVMNTEEQTVGSRFAYYLAGQPAVAQRILDNSGTSGNDPAMSKYARALVKDGGNSLSIAELKEFAILLAHKTAIGNPTVGGEDQAAVLSNVTVQSFQQPNFSQDAPTPTAFNLMVNMVDSGGGELVRLPNTVFIKSKIENKSFYPLDGKYFFRSEILNSRVHYDGGTLKLDSSNRVTGSVLVLGPHANKNPEAVAQLRRGFQWAKIVEVDQDGQPPQR